MFEPLLYLGQFDGGVNTKQRPNKIAANQMASIISMDFVANSLRRAKGYTLFGTEADSDLTGKTLYTHTILSGIELLVKTIGTKLKFYDTVDDAWYAMTDATFTDDLRWAFVTFNSNLYGCNGVDNWIYWKGSTLTTIVNQVTAGSTTIDLPTDKGALYPSSGTVMIQGEAITYSGKSGDQLTGCTITETHAAGSTIILKVDSTTYSTLTKSNTIAFFRNRIYAVDYDNPTIIRHSKLADNTNPETDLVNFTVAGSGSGDAGFGIAPDQLIAIQPIINGNNSAALACFAKDGEVYAFSVTDSGSTTVNAFVPMRTMTTYPINKEMVTVVENDLAIADQYGHIRTLGYGDVNTPLQVRTISQPIEPSLEVTNFEDGCMGYDKRVMYAVGKTTDAETNDIVWYHDANYSAWATYGHWDVVDLARYNGALYGLSAISGNVWKLNDGYEANEGTYYSEAKTGDITFGSPLTYKQMLKLRIGGFITTNCPAYIDIFLDNSEQPITFLISGNNTSIIGQEPNTAVGTVVFGSGVFGGGLKNGVTRREFVAQLLLNDLQPFLKMSIRLRIDAQNVDFELNDLLIFAKTLGDDYWLKAKNITITT